MADINDTFENNINSTSNTSDYISYSKHDYLQHSYVTTILLGISYTLILITGFIGNSMVVYGVFKNKDMHTTTNIFLVNMAIGDWLTVTFCGPVTVAAAIFNRK